MSDASPPPEQSPQQQPQQPPQRPEPGKPPSTAPARPAAARARATSALGARPRDMVISLLILLPLIGTFALLGRSCSFSPLGPTVEQSSVPSVDAGKRLSAVAARAPFPVREPVVPPDWRATSVDQRPGPGGASAVRVGWLTGSGHYLRLVQTNAEEGALVTAETSGPPSVAAPITVAGVEWVRYTGGNGEPAWTRRADGVQWLITGSGVDAEFQALATAVAAAPPLPRAG